MDSLGIAQPAPQSVRCGPESCEKSASTDPSRCRHCRQLRNLDAPNGFCSTACAEVHALIQETHLERYYELQTCAASPLRAATTPTVHQAQWLESLEASLSNQDACQTVQLDVQGLHCAACVWLFEELFEREVDRALTDSVSATPRLPGDAAESPQRSPASWSVHVNPALGRIALTVDQRFPLRRYVHTVEKFGYRLGLPHKEVRSKQDGLLVRFGVVAALAGNAMMFSLAMYLGLAEGPVYTWMRALHYLLGTAAVVVGGEVFIRSAVHGLRHRVVHLDVPIALGIVLAFAGSSWAFFSGRDEGVYVDTISIFVALMLLGRLLQERVLERNRRLLLSHDGVDGILCRRVNSGKVSLVAANQVKEGDRLLLAPGDLLPVDAMLENRRGPPHSSAEFSLAWINGESEPQAFAPGVIVPAGAFLLTRSAVLVSAQDDFSASPLPMLLRQPITDASADAAQRHAPRPFWQRLSLAYVVLVLGAALVGLLIWWGATGDWQLALTVAIAVLVVTCPCAFGIATPLAYELAQGGLRREGLFLRRAGVLDRVLQVRKLLFDKTGTLTTGSFEVEHPSALRALPTDEQVALYNLAVRSAHPKAQAVARALESRSKELDVSPASLFVEHFVAEETPGGGIAGTLIVPPTAGDQPRTKNSWGPTGKPAETTMLCARLGSLPFIQEGGEPPRSAGLTSNDDSTANGFPNGDVFFAINGAKRLAITIREILRPGLADELEQFLAQGYAVRILSGDQRQRVKAIANRLSLNATHAEGDLSPEEKGKRVRALDDEDTLFVGDGINDGLAADAAWVSATPAIDRPFMPSRTDLYLVSPGLAPLLQLFRVARALAKTVRINLAIAAGYNLLAVGLCWAGLVQPWLAAVMMPASSIVALSVVTARLHPGSRLWKF